MLVQFLSDPIDQDNQLREWGLRREPLIEAVLYGETFFNECTANDQKGFNLIIAYDKVGRRLRELHRTNGWTYCDRNNQVAIKNEDLKLRLYACNFCTLTADPDHEPTNLSEKGNSVRGDTCSNRQLSLFDAPQYVPGAVPEIQAGYMTLTLGMNFEGEYPKAEVSLPVRYAGGKLKGLSKRVPLLNGDGLPQNQLPVRRPNDVFGEVDIPIRVKS